MATKQNEIEQSIVNLEKLISDASNTKLVEVTGNKETGIKKNKGGSF